MLNALVKSGSFNVTVLKRSSSTATFPATVAVKTADLSSKDSVTAALKGQDAVVSTVGIEALSAQDILIEAAVAAGVKRFLPSDFGSNISIPKTAALPIFNHKTAIHKQLREASTATSTFTYTLVCTGPFLDWGLDKNFLLNWKETKPKLFDSGQNVFSATTLDSIGQAVVGVLSHPEETKNRFVFVKDIDVSQSQLLEMAKKVDPAKEWQDAVNVDTADLERSSNESLAKGQISMPVMVGYIFRAIFGPPEYGSLFQSTDNKLLGIKGKEEADVEAILRDLMLGRSSAGAQGENWLN